MSDSKKQLWSTVGGILIIPALLVLLYGGYRAFTYNPGPKQPMPKVEMFRVTGQEKNPEGGWSVNLEWDTAHADEVTLEPGVGKVDIAGKKTMWLKQNTTYLLTVRNKTGITGKELEIELPADAPETPKKK
jgi:hypothetical protein